jgi:type IV secretory pathway VirJ component
MQALGDAGFAVALIDSGQALRRLNAPDRRRGCIDLAGPLEWLGSTVERDLGWNQYRPPLILGHGVGGTLAYAALAQSPQTFAGGISVDVQQELALRRQLCRVSTQVRSGDRQLLSWSAPPGARWLVGSTTVASARPTGVGPHATLAPGPLADIYGRTAPAFLMQPTQDSPTSIADLPLVEVSSTTAVDTLAVIYSGDGGWRDIDKQLGDALATRGIAVVGVDSLRYFWSARTAEQVSADLARTLAHYTAAWHIRHVILIGYSFGADVLPFAYNRLPAELQGRVSQITLLAPGRAADFEIQTLGWFGAGPSDDAQPIPPEAARLEHAKVQCIFGTDDAGDSLCTQPTARGMEVVRRPGGHHFDNDYVALAHIVLKGICRRGIACRA